MTADDVLKDLSVNTQDISDREKILMFQSALQDIEEEHHIDCPLKHYFAPGLYAREILLPKGSVVVGKIHKHAHVNNISQGSVIVYTEFGLEEYNAPCQFISKPGTKRVVYALEDTIWTTYHPTEYADGINSDDAEQVAAALCKIEDVVIAPSFDEYEVFKLEQTKGIEVKS